MHFTHLFVLFSQTLDFRNFFTGKQSTFHNYEAVAGKYSTSMENTFWNANTYFQNLNIFKFT